MAKIDEAVSGENSVAITGTATGGNSLGVLGKGDAVGVRGESQNWHAVIGLNTGTQGAGVYGHSAGTGVIGESTTWMGVYGKSDSTTGGAGVMGEGQSGPGVIGKSGKWVGVYGETAGIENGPAGVWGEHKGAGVGVKAVSKDGAGLAAYSGTQEAIHAETRSSSFAAIAAISLNEAGTGAAVYARKAGAAGHAGFFDGNVHVTGKLTAVNDIELVNADCAEDFDVVGDIDTGTVMVLSDSGALKASCGAYDKRVVGVVSGAGDYKPGIVLDRKRRGPDRQPIGLLGKVYCKVDARNAPIEVGDLLTTSQTPGHAMKATDPSRAFGAVIGKALRPCSDGLGLVPILIALQ